VRGLFGGRWSGPQFILTHTPPTDETDPSYTFVAGDVRNALVLVLGADLVGHCLKAGLVDEILIHLAPELLGAGIRLFGAPELRGSLETLDVSASGQVANLRYRVAR
jgi:dihydrofolate reductase